MISLMYLCSQALRACFVNLSLQQGMLVSTASLSRASTPRALALARPCTSPPCSSTSPGGPPNDMSLFYLCSQALRACPFVNLSLQQGMLVFFLTLQTSVSKKNHVLSVNEVSCFLVLFFDPPPPYRPINVPRVTERHGQQGVLQSGTILHFI